MPLALATSFLFNTTRSTQIAPKKSPCLTEGEVPRWGPGGCPLRFTPTPCFIIRVNILCFNSSIFFFPVDISVSVLPPAKGTGE